MLWDLLLSNFPPLYSTKHLYSTVLLNIFSMYNLAKFALIFVEQMISYVVLNNAALKCMKNNYEGYLQHSRISTYNYLLYSAKGKIH